MKVRLKLFASLRELTGVEDETLDIPEHISTLGELRDHLRSRGESWSQALDAKRAIRGAINQRMAQESDALHEGDEIAFFPPVTGG
ncbi:molybdopterin converting factor subunit 1 [beta proteobacterium MWH-UniP1]